MPLIDFVQHAYVSLDCGIIVDAKGANSDVERLWSGQQAMHNIQQAFLHLMSLRQNTCVTQHAATVCELEGWAWPGKLIQSHSWHMQRGVSNRSRTQGSVGDEGRQGSAGMEARQGHGSGVVRYPLLPWHMMKYSLLCYTTPVVYHGYLYASTTIASGGVATL